jgi:hypothetical protein
MTADDDADGFPLLDVGWDWMDRVPIWLFIAVATFISVGALMLGVVLGS